MTAAVRRKAIKKWHAEALRLRIAGLTYPQIAQHLGKATSTVYEAIQSELAEVPVKEGVDRLRAIECARLDAIVAGHLTKATRGEANAAFVVLSAIQTRAKIMGLAVAEKVDINAKMTLSFDAKEELATRLQDLVERRAKRDATSGAASEGTDE